MTEKNKKSEIETAVQRDKKGRFLPGSAGGPGRGKKSKPDLDLSEFGSLEAAEQVIRKEMTSPDPKVRIRAADSMMKLSRLKQPEEKKPVMSPFTRAFISWENAISTYMPLDMDLIDVLEKMEKVCAGCEKMGFSDNPFKIVDDYENSN